MNGEIYLQIGGNKPLILVVTAPDGLPDYYGPFPDQTALDTAKEALLQSGVEMGRCDTAPLHQVITKP